MENTDIKFDSNETNPEFLSIPNEFTECRQNLQEEIKSVVNPHNSDSNSDAFSISSNPCPLTSVQLTESDDILTQDTEVIHNMKLTVQLLSSHQSIYQESVERKQYSEREITYNLLLRKLVNDYLDRTVTYSHQPKHILTILKSVLERNFPEFNGSFHREKICAYLKACRRKAKKNSGETYVRISARYLSAGTAARMAEEIYMKEHEYLVNAIMNGNKSYHAFNQSLMFNDDHGSSTNEVKNFTTTTAINTNSHQEPQCQIPELTPTRSSTNAYILNDNNNFNLTTGNHYFTSSYGEPMLNSLNSVIQQIEKMARSLDAYSLLLPHT
ncbi:unnamed protein product [Trichobilharzia regenti]|nr:unnamed protein product [Trichobilharzia regenti]